MPDEEFPLFPLQTVALPGELIPLHIFEERYKTMINDCLAGEREFGIVWLSDDGLRHIGSLVAVLDELDHPRRIGKVSLALKHSERARPTDEDVHAAVLHPLEYLFNSGGAPDVPQTVVG